jgi:polyisoprenoid-binding protein YceI
MKSRQLLIVIVTLLFLQPTYLSAQSYNVKSHKMTVTGSSTLHEWESVAEKLQCKSAIKIENNALVDIKEAVVKIPVQSLKGSKGKMMDSKTYDAFNYEKNPWIIFTLSTKKINTLTADLKGTLTMAGATKPIDLTVNYKVLPNGDLQITGSKKLKMSDFNMETPTAMMGTIKVGDEVTINFELVLTNTVNSL